MYNLVMNFDYHRRRLSVKALIASSYFSLVWASFFYLNISPSKKVNLVFLVAMFVLSYLLFCPLIKRLNRLNFKPVSTTRSTRVKIFVIAAAASFICMLLWIIAYYPGSFSVDSLEQYEQAITGAYNDWHPVWHTLIVFNLPLKLFGTPASIIICQSVYFSLVFGYAILVIHELAGMKATIIVSLIIMLNPYVGSILLFPWKDVAFAITALFCTIFIIRLMSSHSCKTKTLKVAIFGIVLGFATVFRHNAILYTAPLIIVLFVNVDKKTFFTALAVTLATVFIIKVPIYGALNVEQPDGRVSETTGLPMTIIGNVTKETPDLMDDEVSDFVYSVATEQQWQELYQRGSFNSIKHCGVNTSPVEEKGILGMLRLTMKCFKESPSASLDAFIALTSQVYGFERTGHITAMPSIVVNDFDIQYEQNPGSIQTTLKTTLDSYISFVENSVFRYFKAYSFLLFALLLVFLSKLEARSLESWKKTSIVFPILMYDFGTMFLLSGDDARFFFITSLVIPILVVYLLSEEKRRPKGEERLEAQESLEAHG